MYYLDHRVAKVLMNERIEQAINWRQRQHLRRKPRHEVVEDPVDTEVGTVSDPKAA